MDEVEQGTIGSYQVLRTIGRGSMGTVYEALEPSSGRRVAVKQLTGELAKEEELAERFRREALALSGLKHPNITSVLDFGEEGERLYLVMELLLGRDLKLVIESGSLGPLPERLRIMTEVAAGMGFVHAQALVHRDLKPGNIHVTPEGTAKIMDFGLVRLGDSEMTRTGMVMGSPSYMSPEQLRGEKADARGDVFALGAVFYEVLTGRRAFGGKGLAEVMMAVIGKEPPRLAEWAPDTPIPVALVVSRCLKKDPRERYRDAGELHAALEVLLAVYGGD